MRVLLGPSFLSHTIPFASRNRTNPSKAGVHRRPSPWVESERDGIPAPPKLETVNSCRMCLYGVVCSYCRKCQNAWKRDATTTVTINPRSQESCPEIGANQLASYWAEFCWPRLHFRARPQSYASRSCTCAYPVKFVSRKQSC